MGCTPIQRNDLRALSAFADLSYRTDRVLFNDACESAVHSVAGSDMSLDSNMILDESLPLDLSANQDDLEEEALIASPDNEFQLSPDANAVDLINSLADLSSISPNTTFDDFTQDDITIDLEDNLADLLDNI